MVRVAVPGNRQYHPEVSNESALAVLLEADDAGSSRRCAEALRGGARIQSLEVSTSIEQHLDWITRHKKVLVEWNGDSVEKVAVHLRDPATTSVGIARVGMDDVGAIPFTYFYVVLPASGDRVIGCLAVTRGQPPGQFPT